MSDKINFVVTKQVTDTYAVVADDVAEARKMYDEGKSELLMTMENTTVRAQPTQQTPPHQVIVVPPTTEAMKKLAEMKSEK